MSKILQSAKAVAAFVGAVVTALLTVYTGNEILTVVSVVATAVATYAVPNADA